MAIDFEHGNFRPTKYHRALFATNIRVYERSRLYSHWSPFAMWGQSSNFFSVIAIITFETLYLYSVSSNHYLFEIIVDCSLEDGFLLNKQVFYATFTLSHVFCELTSLRKNVFILFSLPQVFLCVCKNCSNFPTMHNTTEKKHFSFFS